jgi:quercetin dioxygenase-like cupin family protein
MQLGRSVKPNSPISNFFRDGRTRFEKNLSACHKRGFSGVLDAETGAVAVGAMEREEKMNRTQWLLVVGIVLGLGGITYARLHEHGESVKPIGQHDIQEKLDGKETTVTVVEVTIEPGEGGVPHRHPGPAIVYVLEGEYELGIDDQPTKRFKAGQTFYEPGGHLHRVSRNPAAKGRTRLIATVIHPKDAKEIAVPEQASK